MKEKLTELVMILDRSGSMGGLESDTIGGYNSMLKKQMETEGDVLVSTVLFDDRSELIFDRVPLEEMPELTEETYYVRGCTALLDAVGGAIRHIETIQKHIREEDRPERTIFVITTDGLENASREYSCEQVKEMVDRRKKDGGWEFIFLGANIDAVETARRIGISADRAANYHSDREGTALNYTVLAEAVSDMRCSDRRIGGGWKKRIDDDFRKRGTSRRGRKK
ncbi:vWA domain-containing protein [Eubacterium pyruvativorans]|uniref:vWA domain-containing protein n=1 Tax=Eubacterium pyruvativorans TaxID=155865 RepID=UPI0023F2B79D|nr:hypothetical protein [Eubacterium pyruvativorans]MCI5747602.1 hypothetical protein [Eubacterium pyruvativorans]MDD7684796.1 hypothetical protein [Eubacterium pyruvativorans]